MNKLHNLNVSKVKQDGVNWTCKDCGREVQIIPKDNSIKVINKGDSQLAKEFCTEDK